MLNAVRVRAPHIHARRRDALSLPGTELCSEKLIEGFLLAVLSEPQRLAGFQVADHRDELHLLTKVDLVHPHLRQAILAPGGIPPLQILQVDGPHRAGCQSKMPGNLAHRGTFASLPHSVLKIFAERCFTGQLRHLFHAHPTLWTAHPVQFDDHLGLILPPRQVAHLALVAIVNLRYSSPTSRADQLAISSLSPHPQPQNLVCLINLMSKYSVTRPIEDPRKFAIAHAPSLAETAPRQKPAHLLGLYEFLLRAVFLKTLLAVLPSILSSRAAFELENLALRRQIGVLQRSAAERPKLTAADRLFWICLSRLWREGRQLIGTITGTTVKGDCVFWRAARLRNTARLAGLRTVSVLLPPERPPKIHPS